MLNDITKCTKQNLISLEDINENGLKLYENNSYKILGLPFYNFEEEEYFKNNFRELLL